MLLHTLISSLAMLLALQAATSLAHADTAGATRLRIATFQVDATPPLGTPLCDGAVDSARQIVDPLSARGIVLLTNRRPIVLCVVDWVGIGNAGHDAWREALAEAAVTSLERVSVHTVHQHDAPGCDFAAEELLAKHRLSGEMFDPEFARDVIARAALAMRESLRRPSEVTHLGLGTGIVDKVASNRRILGADGKVAVVRYSSSRIPQAIAAPEGVIDPELQLISFWNGNRPLASVTHYATHPQSYYGQGGVSADFVGMAREMREDALPVAAHLHFNGAGGNVAAGKYNDGSSAVRPVLARRLADGMKAAWENTHKMPISASDVRWEFVSVSLPLRDLLAEDKLLATLQNDKSKTRYRIKAARDLVYLRRVQSGRQISINCLHLGPARVLYLPGELFVEYQLAAKELRPEAFVAMAAYGDYGPGYIGTEVSYSQGGYETGPVSRTAPQVEDVLMSALRTLLRE